MPHMTVEELAAMVDEWREAEKQREFWCSAYVMAGEHPSRSLFMAAADEWRNTSATHREAIEAALK